ncbi:hypothetical protein [Pseudoxanthomonas sp. GM95]|uniref:hypothetical protein n=1 Tax=Pseudoxanthomonas sp. GM95 TaxID=1881043 RepID=UPI00111330FA|nr:hypothetical protein [Pseudoxanthomonas sp. GM95]
MIALASVLRMPTERRKEFCMWVLGLLVRVRHNTLMKCHQHARWMTAVQSQTKLTLTQQKIRQKEIFDAIVICVTRVSGWLSPKWKFNVVIFWSHQTRGLEKYLDSRCFVQI